MTQAEMLKTLRAELQEWIEERLDRIVAAADHDQLPTLPTVCDFSLVLAWEDFADPDSPTYYPTISSYVPGYRLSGLHRAALDRYAPQKDDD